MTDWNDRLLSVGAMAMLRRLLVFVSNWDIAGALFIAAPDGLSQLDVVTFVDELIDKSFVVPDERRFRLVTPARAYLRERISPVEFTMLRARHLRFVRELLERAYDGFGETPIDEWLANLDFDIEDSAAALEWSLVEANAPLEGIALVAAMTRWWLAAGRVPEGERWVDLAFSYPAHELSALTFARLHLAKALYSAQRDRESESLDALERAMRQFDAAANVRGFAEALRQPAFVRRYSSDREGLATVAGSHAFLRATQLANRDAEADAESILREALRLHERAGNTYDAALTLCDVATVVLELRGDHRAAADDYARSLLTLRRVRDTRGIARVVSGLADVAVHLGRFEEAMELTLEALEAERASHEGTFVSQQLCRLGVLHLAQQQRHDAVAYFRKGLREAELAGDGLGVRTCLEGLAEIAADNGTYEVALHLIAYATGLPESGRIVASSFDRSRRARTATEIEANVAPGAFVRFWNRGLLLTRSEAMAEALSIGP